MKLHLRIFSIITLLTFPFTISEAQDSGDQMFDNTILHEIRMEFSEFNYWNILINNYETNSDPFADKPYLMGKVTIDGVEVDSVGVRLKGFSSYWGDSFKKPFKIDFNEFVPDKRFDGLRKLNLNNSTGDPSMQREVICYDLMRSSGVRAPRVSFSKVYINGEYWGIYQSVEQVDKEFLQNNFSNNDGNLFKNLSWNKLEWNGTEVSDYDKKISLKTNVQNNDWSGFINLMDVLNNIEDSNFKTEIEKIFNVDLFLKTLAVDVSTNNWDSYLQHGRNWYMYEDLQTGLFHWIPWDYNFALPGAQEIDEDECVIFPEINPFMNGTTTVQFFERTFSTLPVISYYWDFGDGNTSSEQEPQHTYSNHGTYQVCFTARNGPDCERTQCKSINTNDNIFDCPAVSDSDFEHSVGEALVTTIEFLPSCCNIWDEDCEDVYGFFSGNGGSRDFKIDQRDNNGILISRLLNEQEYFERYLDYFCSLVDKHFDVEEYFDMMDENKDLINDAVESEPNSLFTYSEFLLDIGEEGLKMILADRHDSLSMELATFTSCTPTPTIAEGDVVINEFVASNDAESMISDEAGEFDDWIEIYNNTSSTIDLSDAYLSDDPDNLLKWNFPSGTTIGSGGYKIVWADQNEDQPGMHANFRLSKEGDEINLTNSDGSNIDGVEFGEQETNVAQARTPNGTGDFIAKTATFNANNDTGDPNSTNDLQATDFKLFPNPATDLIEVEMKNGLDDNYTIEINSAAGQLVKTLNSNRNNTRISIRTLESGFYFLSVRDDHGNLSTSKFIKVK